MIKTECEEKDIDKYNFKFICVDESGEHVRHVFGKGSFDPEETFDTLVTCSGCTADADDLMVSAKQSKGDNNTNKTAGPTSTNALLRQIAADVGELKVEMANASQNVERLNAAVFTVAPPAQAATPAPQEATPAPEAATPAPSSLVHRGASALRARNGRVTRMKAIKVKAHAMTEVRKSHIHKIRRRHTEDNVDTADQDDAQDRNGRVDDDAQDGTYAEEDSQSQDDSQGQDDSQDQDDAHRQDDVQQEDDNTDNRDQADVRNADSDEDQRDDEHDVQDEDRSSDGDRDVDDRDRGADDDGQGEEGADQ